MGLEHESSTSRKFISGPRGEFHVLDQSGRATYIDGKFIGTQPTRDKQGILKSQMDEEIMPPLTNRDNS